jgi:hypothetical protein
LTKITKKEMIALPDVKGILETKKVEEMDQIQKWTYDYVNKFSKIRRGGRSGKYITFFFRGNKGFYIWLEKINTNINFRKYTSKNYVGT